MHLSDYMAQKKLGDDEVAKALGCSRPTVSRIRRRLIRPSWETIEEIRKFTEGAVTAADFEQIAGTEQATVAG